MAGTSSRRRPPTCSAAATRLTSARRCRGSSPSATSIPATTAPVFVGEVIFRDTFRQPDHQRQCLAPGRPWAESWIVEIAGERIDGLSRTYGDQATGSLMALAGSSGWIEIAVVNGDAARQLAAGPGTTVWFRRKNSTSPS